MAQNVLSDDPQDMPTPMTDEHGATETLTDALNETLAHVAQALELLGQHAPWRSENMRDRFYAQVQAIWGRLK